MLKDFIQVYFERYMIRGYKIIGNKLTAQYFFSISFLTIIWLYILFFNEWIALLILLRMVLMILEVGSLIDTKLTMYRQEAYLESKIFISKYLKNSLHFNHSTQYKEISILLKQQAEVIRNSYNLLPYSTMTLAVLLFISSLAVQSFPNQLVVIIITTLAFSLLIIALNPLINAFINLFKKDKKSMLTDLSNTIYEIYLNEHITENKVSNSPKRKSKNR